MVQAQIDDLRGSRNDLLDTWRRAGRFGSTPRQIFDEMMNVQALLDEGKRSDSPRGVTKSSWKIAHLS